MRTYSFCLESFTLRTACALMGIMECLISNSIAVYVVVFLFIILKAAVIIIHTFLRTFLPLPTEIILKGGRLSSFFAVVVEVGSTGHNRNTLCM